MDDKQKVYWGDIHRQTAWTCGEGSPADHFRVAKEELGLGFAAVTDNARVEDPKQRLFPGARLQAHPHFLGGLQAHSITPKQWLSTQKAVREYTKDGEFIAFLAYEWCSARYGDHNVYYADGEGPLYLPDRLEELYRGEGIQSGRLIIPHHCGYARGRRGTDWNVHQPELERLVEIYSSQHGSSEGVGPSHYPLYSRSMGNLELGSSVFNALERGYKLGFTAGSDAHYLRQKPGIVGVFAPCLSREAIFAGLFQRRTIASTGPKYEACFTVGPHFIGSMLTLDYLPQISIYTADDQWQRLELVRNGEVIKSWLGGQGGQRLHYQEKEQGLKPDNYYYVRIFLANKETVWLSPIWVSYLPDTPFAQDILYWQPEVKTHFWGRQQKNGQALLKLHRQAEAASGITGIEFIIRGGPAEVIAQQKSALRPGQTAVCLMDTPHISTVEAYGVRYLDEAGNIRIMERRRLLSKKEATSFKFEV